MRVSALLGKAFSSGCSETRLNGSFTNALWCLLPRDMAPEVRLFLTQNTCILGG